MTTELKFSVFEMSLRRDMYDAKTLTHGKTKLSTIYEATKNVEAVRQLLGHASVAASTVYRNLH